MPEWKPDLQMEGEGPSQGDRPALRPFDSQLKDGRQQKTFYSGGVGVDESTANRNLRGLGDWELRGAPGEPGPRRLRGG